MGAQRIGSTAGCNQLGQTFDDRSLANPSLPDQHWIVLLATRKDFYDPFDLLEASDSRIQLALGGELSQIATEVIQRWRFGFLLGPLRGRLLTRFFRRGRHVTAQQTQRLSPGLLERHTRIRQYLRRNSLFLTQQAQQQMLSAHVGVVQLPSFTHGEFEHLLGARGVRQIGTLRSWRLAFLHGLLDALLDLVQIHIEVGEYRGCDSLPLPNQAQENVFGPHIFVMQTSSLFPRHLEDFSNPVGKVVSVH